MGRVAAGVLQVAAGPLRHVHDIVLFVDDDGGRRVLLEHPLVQVAGRQPGAGILFRDLIARSTRSGAVRRRHVAHHEPHVHVTAVEEVGVLVERHEQVARALDRFRGPEKQTCARVQREVHDLQHTPLRGAVQIDEEVAARSQIEV